MAGNGQKSNGKNKKRGLSGEDSRDTSKQAKGATCPICSNVVREAQQVIYCEGSCNQWMHRQCASLTTEAFIKAEPGYSGHSITSSLDQILSQRPLMADINKIVVPRIQAEWEDFAFALHYEISTVQNIGAKHNGNPKKCCRDLFIDWLSTDHGDGPKTWKTLVEKLKEVEELAAAISETIINDLEKLADSNSSSAS